MTEGLVTEGLVEVNEAATVQEEGTASSELENWSAPINPESGLESDSEASHSPGKKKVTYYLPEALQNQLKMRSTLEGRAMSEVVEQALRFYLEHGDLVKRDGVGHTHQVYACPACQSMLMFRHGKLQSIPKALTSEVVLQEWVQ